jgi:cation transport ATPase
MYPIALHIGKGTLRKMRQNLGWAIGYNAIALPIAAGVFEPALTRSPARNRRTLHVRLQPAGRCQCALAETVTTARAARRS